MTLDVLNPSWICAIALLVASSARPEAAFWREKLRAAICSTREVERKETVIVARSAVMRRVRMRAEPEEEGLEEGLTTEDTERTEFEIKWGGVTYSVCFLSFMSRRS